MNTHPFRRTIAALLLCAIMCAAFAACSGGDDTAATTAQTSAPTETQPTETQPRYTTSLPERDLEGFVMTFLQRSEENDSFYDYGIYAEEQTGDIVRDAVYDRNLMLMEKYNFGIEEIADEGITDTANKAKSAVLAGDDSYDMFVLGANYFAGYMQQGLLIDLNTLDNFDFDAEWWYKELNEGLSIGGMLPMTVGAHMLVAKNGLYMLIFNKDVAEDNGISPDTYYNLVRNGEWTADEFIAAVKSVPSTDLNGDGNIDHNDFYSFGTENYGIHTLTLASGFLIADKDENDIPSITIYSEKNVEILEKYMQLFGDHTTTCVTQAIQGVDSTWSTSSEMWKNGQMYFRVLNVGEGLREIEYDYGVLPNPKYTEDQEDYYHTASIWNAPVMGIPKTCSDPDKTSYINEVMACESLNGLTDIYYQNYLTEKLVRDEESIEMLRIVHDSLYFDVGAVFNWGSMLTILYTISQTGNNNFASAYAAKESATISALQKSLDAIAEYAQ